MDRYIRFIVGKADRNISAAVRGELISMLESDKSRQKIIYIVPDQFEYETEKAVYRILEEKSLLSRYFEIKITTFTRLCYEILEESGEHRPFADDIVKNIIMHKTLNGNDIVLSALNKIAARPGFCAKMVKTVSALKTSGITARDLELSLDALTKLDKKLSPDQPIIKKLNETCTLYAKYEELLKEYVDKLDVTSMAADNIEKEKCSAFENASVFVDCFNDFTQSQLHFLECVIRKAENVTFGFTTDHKSDCDVFCTANAHIGRLKQSSEEAGLSVKLVTEGIEGRFAEGSPLEGLSRHLFQNAKDRDALGDSCELVTARGVYDELDYVAAKIKELTIDRKMRYNEIAVLCTDVGTYGKYVETAFKKYEIPIFIDTPEPILYQPLIGLVNSILNALADYSVDTVLSCVKTKFFAKPKTDDDEDDKSDNEFDKHVEEEAKENGEQLTLSDAHGEKAADVKGSAKKADKKPKYTTLADKDVDEFEKYIYEWDLKTSHLKEEFSFPKEKTEEDYTRQNAELVRKAVAEPLWQLRESLISEKTLTGAKITEKLYDFLINTVGVRRAIYKRCKNEQNDALDADKVALYQRLWDSLIDIFNKLNTELANTKITLSEYSDLFREICAATKLADPPQFIDCVLVGDIDRTRADNIKAAFIVGASSEAFPTPASESGIFSQYEIELICDKIVHIEGDSSNTDVTPYIETLSHIGENNRREYCLKSAKDQYYLSLYRAYRAVTLPTEYLCISCPKADVSGEALMLSDVFGEITSTFKDTETISAESRGNRFYCRTSKAAKMRYAMGLNGKSEENRVLREVLKLNKEDGEFVKTLDEIRDIRKDRLVGSSKHFSGEHTLDPKTAGLLFDRTVGATLIEKIVKCKFKYFCEYGLRIHERNKRSFTPSKRGEAMHYVFDKTFKRYRKNMNDFFKLQRSEFLALSKKYLSEYREKYTNNDSKEDKRTEYLFNNIANAATDVLITMQTELFARRYRPKFTETRIKADSENNKHEIVDNESAVTGTLPEAVLFSDEEKMPDDGTFDEPDDATEDDAPLDESTPYLITAPLTIDLEDGSKITVQGIIDRIDMFREGVNDDGKPIAYIRVVDYKRSAHTFDLNIAENGINIQMLLYLFALQSANKDNPTLELRPGGVSYVPSLSGGASDKPLSPYRLLAMNYHESGLFIEDENTAKDLNNYQEAIFKKFDEDSSIEAKDLEKIKESFIPQELNYAKAQFFDKLRAEVMQKITENLNELFSGTINALPTIYSETEIDANGNSKSKQNEPCKYCRFREICQNAGKNVNKIENAKLRTNPTKEGDTETYWENKYISKEETGDGK